MNDINGTKIIHTKTDKEYTVLSIFQDSDLLYFLLYDEEGTPSMITKQKFLDNYKVVVENKNEDECSLDSGTDAGLDVTSLIVGRRLGF
tara:strand:- start:1253 stop:1519 length:267 start_codon:yes stop_codon:yes gene_type:complete